MKKLLVVALSFFTIASIFGITRVSAAEEVVDSNIIVNGDFGETVGELPFGDPAFGPEFGPAAGWGSLPFDSPVVACVDPLDSTNTVIRYTYKNSPFCSFFHFVSGLVADTTYEISLDYLVVGTTNNFGMRFAGGPTLEHTFYNGDSTEGWQHASWEWTTAADGNYDSIAIWMNTMSNAENAGYIDNIVVKVKGTETNLVPTGNFEGFLDNLISEDLELPFGEPAFGPDFGPAAGWGSLVAWDSPVSAVVDPLDSTNTVIRYSYKDKNFCSFFHFVKGLVANTTYTIDLDYLVVGTTDNFGMRFAGGPTLEHTFYSGDSTEGWQHASWEWTTAADGNYDSIAIWMNTMGNAENAGYIDNIVVKVKDTDINLVPTGNFEGFLDYAPKNNLPETEADVYGNTGVNASYGNGNLLLGEGWFAQETDSNKAGKYQLSLNYTGTTQNLSLLLVDALGDTVETIKLVENGVDANNGKLLTTVTLKAGFTTVKVVNEGGEVTLDNLSVCPILEYPFKEGTTYYQSESITINGDFEAFEVGTVFSEVQLEGAWGSVKLDNPATIQNVDGSKVIDITAGSNVYSSAFLMTSPDLEVGQLMRLSYDIKLVLSKDASTYAAINTCLVGGSNTSYYTVDYTTLDFAAQTNKTSGAEAIHYPITITDKGNGWYTVSFDYQITKQDLISTNSLRFLFAAQSAEDHMYIDNVNFYTLSETPFDPTVNVESVVINDGVSLSLNVGDSKTLSCTVNPTDATDKSLTYKSSDEKVATVDANGKITAVAKGACTITVTASNGVSSQIAVVVNAASEPAAKGCQGGCGGSIIASAFGLVALTGAVAFVANKKRKEQ